MILPDLPACQFFGCFASTLRADAPSRDCVSHKAVEYGAPSTALLHFAQRSIERPVRRELHGRHLAQREPSPLLQWAKIPPEALAIARSCSGVSSQGMEDPGSPR